ncbi:MAG TPA: 4-hydroxy-tetrahydrodipicolinate synthase [Abditibacteriaceae bacterium]|nr:4-hydroxy-tetrahydrodipicolinate synthase [Abditibacteriaceae bacterium]
MNTFSNSPFGPLPTAMVTPFRPDGAVDYGRAEELAARLINYGSTGLVVSGTTGESPTLTPQEKLELFRCVKRAAGDVPVIANTGDNETAFSIEFSYQAEEIGLDGLLLVVPYYNRPNQEGLYQHFKAIAAAVDLPCILYNVPSRTGRNMEAQTVARLAEMPNIVGVKEAGGDMAQVAYIRALTDDAFAIYSGNDGDTLPMLPLGCCGIISVISHIAGRPFRQMMEAFWSGDLSTALALHLRLLPVCDALFPPTAPNPVMVKAALQLQGFDCGGLRLPLVEATDAERANLRHAMHEAGLL